jgi:hypothetical protein
MPTKTIHVSSELPLLKNVESELPAITPELQTSSSYSYYKTPIFVSSTMLFFIACLVFILMSGLIKKGKEPAEILKTFGIPLIIVAAVFVVIPGLNANQLTPVIGLLGTIAGYLLGKSEETGAKHNTTKRPIQRQSTEPDQQHAEN